MFFSSFHPDDNHTWKSNSRIVALAEPMWQAIGRDFASALQAVPSESKAKGEVGAVGVVGLGEHPATRGDVEMLYLKIIACGMGKGAWSVAKLSHIVTWRVKFTVGWTVLTTWWSHAGNFTYLKPFSSTCAKSAHTYSESKLNHILAQSIRLQHRT